MIVCGWCNAATEPGHCSDCGRDPALPWVQRATVPPVATADDREGGRPKLDPGQARQKARLARKDLGSGATNAQVAEHLGISERTLQRWEHG